MRLLLTAGAVMIGLVDIYAPRLSPLRLPLPAPWGRAPPSACRQQATVLRSLLQLPAGFVTPDKQTSFYWHWGSLALKVTFLVMRSASRERVNGLRAFNNLEIFFVLGDGVESLRVC